MAEQEKRQPRAFYTRVLTRICERLDSQDTHGFTWKERLSPEDVFRGVMRIESLWVVGSYARGAVECGDLDVVVEVRCIEGDIAPFKKVKSKALGRPPGLRCYSGNPKENSSHISFPEAVPIWSRGADWREAVASIVEDPNAVRFSRPIDEVPLRHEQLYAGVDRLEKILKRQREQQIQWRFLPVDHSADPLGDLNDLEAHVLERLGFGKRTHELLPHLLRYIRDHTYPMYDRHKTYSNAAKLAIEGTLMVMGRPRIADDALDTLEFSRVLLMPHFSGRGPNGIWELRRGPKHPFEERLRGLGAYLLETEDGLPSRIRGSSSWQKCQLIQLFATEQQAASMLEQHEPLLPQLVPRWVEGSQLLNVLSYADVVEILASDGGSRVLALNQAGATVLNDDDGPVEREHPDHVFAALESVVGRRAARRR